MSSAFTARPEIRGTFGVVSSTHWLASQVAMGVLERGGNAFDAAAAGGFALQIVEPHLNGPGGEVPILFWSEDEQRMRALCGQDRRPRWRRRPISVAWVWTWCPASACCRQPCRAPSAPGSRCCATTAPGSWPTCSRLPLPMPATAFHWCRASPRPSWRCRPCSATNGPARPRSGCAMAAPAPDALFRTPAIAATYTRIVEQAQAPAGPPRPHRGRAAYLARRLRRRRDRRLLHTCGRARHHGPAQPRLLRKSDLAQWRPGYDEPATVQYGHYTVAKCGPWSQGPVHLQQLAILRHLGMDGWIRNHRSSHRIAEAAKLAFADRTAWYGDPAFVEVPAGAAERALRAHARGADQ